MIEWIFIEDPADVFADASFQLNEHVTRTRLTQATLSLCVAFVLPIET
jgi:hypothetical protein